MGYEKNSISKRIKAIGHTKEFIADYLGISIDRFNNVIYNKLKNSEKDLALIEKFITKKEK